MKRKRSKNQAVPIFSKLPDVLRQRVVDFLLVNSDDESQWSLYSPISKWWASDIRRRHPLPLVLLELFQKRDVEGSIDAEFVAENRVPRRFTVTDYMEHIYRQKVDFYLYRSWHQMTNPYGYKSNLLPCPCLCCGLTIQSYACLLGGPKNAQFKLGGGDSRKVLWQKTLGEHCAEQAACRVELITSLSCTPIHNFPDNCK